MNWFKRIDVWRELARRTGKCLGTLKYHTVHGYLPAGQTRTGYKGVWFTAEDLAEAVGRCRIRGWLRDEVTEMEMVK